MNIPGGVMLRVLSLWYSIGAAVALLVPPIGFIWENISTGKQILEFIGDIPEWANFERNLEANRDSLKRKREQLRCMEEDLIEELKTIELRNNGKRKKEVDNWLSNVEAKTPADDSTEEESERRIFVFRFLFRAWIGKCLKMEEEEVDELIKRREALGSGLGLILEPNNGNIQHQLVTSALVGEASSKKRDEIRTTLFKPEMGILGILGGKGMGKTTMMANMHNEEIAGSDSFKHVFYVTIKEGVDLHRLQAAIGEAMNLRDLGPIEDPRRRASRIDTALDKCEKYLLILDGLSEYFPLTDVGISIERIERGRGKLVVVSRSRKVCQKTNCQKIIKLERLPDDDAEELFMKTLSSPAQLSQNIQEIASNIIRKCGGVPSMIVDTAESLRGVDDIHEWSVKYRELSR